ncbi:MAG: extracellular solute-binding protein [Burkholderiaceae bacterium]|nr:extracellular solute-binding protein [Microbacteriaceae bacterium]
MDRRTFIGGGLLGAATFALAGCAGTLPPLDSGSETFTRPPTGTVEVWCRSATQSGLVALVAAFNAAHPRLTVNLTPVPDAQYVTKLATSIRGGRPPDVVDIDDINSQLFIFRDAFADLTDLVQALPYFGALSTGHLKLLEYQNRLFGIPYLADNSMLYVNTDILRNADVDLASSSISLTGLMGAAKKIRRLGGETFAWTFPGNSPGALGFVFQPHVWATGRDLITGPIGSQQGDILGNDALEQTLDFYRQLWTDKLVSTRAFSDDASSWGADFRSGTVGMMPVSYGALLQTPPEMMKKFDAVLLPGPTSGSAFFDGGDNMCIPNGAVNAGGGWEFLKFATAMETQSALPDGGYLPVRSDVLTSEYREKYPLTVLPLENLDKGYAPQTLAYNLLINQPSGPFLRMFREAVFGSGTLPAMKAAQSGFDRILEQAQV